MTGPGEPKWARWLVNTALAVVVLLMVVMIVVGALGASG